MERWREIRLDNIGYTVGLLLRACELPRTPQSGSPTSENSLKRKSNFRKSTYPEAGTTDDPCSQRSSLPRRSSIRSRRSSIGAKCSLILCLNSCSGIASPGSLGSPGRSSKPPPRSRSCRSRSCPPRPCPPPLDCLSLSLPTWPSSFLSTSLVSISLVHLQNRFRV